MPMTGRFLWTNKQNNHTQQSPRFFFRLRRDTTNTIPYRVKDLSPAPENHKPSTCSRPFLYSSFSSSACVEQTFLPQPIHWSKKPPPNQAQTRPPSYHLSTHHTELNRYQAIPGIIPPSFPSASVCNATLMPSNPRAGRRKNAAESSWSREGSKGDSAFMRLVFLASFLFEVSLLMRREVSGGRRFSGGHDWLIKGERRREKGPQKKRKTRARMCLFIWFNQPEEIGLPVSPGPPIRGRSSDLFDVVPPTWSLSISWNSEQHERKYCTDYGPCCHSFTLIICMQGRRSGRSSDLHYRQAYWYSDRSWRGYEIIASVKRAGFRGSFICA